MPAKQRKQFFAQLPSTLEKSPPGAQDIYEATLQQAEKTYADDQARAHRVAWSAVKKKYVKRIDHWQAKR